MFIEHYGVSLAAKRLDACLSLGLLFLAVRQLRGIFRGDGGGGFLVGSAAEGINPISTAVTGSSEEATMERAT